MPATMKSDVYETNPSSQSTDTAQGGELGVTNNINISVNVASDGSASVTTDSEGGSDYSQAKGFSEKIKSSVLDVIRQEKRVGGSLSI